MNFTMKQKLFTALTVTLLSQSISATNVVPDNRFMSENEQSVTIDATKFSKVWFKLNKNNNSDANSQVHLQQYLEESLSNEQGTLDVKKFSKIWNKAGNNQNTTAQSHLQKSLVSLVKNASKREICTHTK